MPESQVRQQKGAVKWRTVRLKDGRTVQVAVVKKGKKGEFGGPADGVHTQKTKGT